MNRSIIRYILGSVLKIEAAFMLLPCIVAVCYGEKLMRAESPGPSVGKILFFYYYSGCRHYMFSYNRHDNIVF